MTVGGTPGRHLRTALAVLLLVTLVACGGGRTGTDGSGASPTGSPTTEPSAGSTSATAGATPTPTGPLQGTVRLYTSVTQDTVDAVVAAYTQAHPQVEVEVFRAPTGELNARLAAEQRDDDVRADVLWLTDPLSMQQLEAQGLLRTWTPTHADDVPQPYREPSFWGTRLLNVVVVHAEDLAAPPRAWSDLARGEWEAPVAIPDPGFAGSAFGALGYFALADDFGFDFYRALAEAGAVGVQAPGEVVTGVAEGRFSAGMTLDRLARDAVEAGAPIRVVAPAPGAIAVYSPIAVVASAGDVAAAESLADFVLGRPAQQIIADTGWQPVREDVEWREETDTVSPDWRAAFERQDELLERYRQIMGG